MTNGLTESGGKRSQLVKIGELCQEQRLAVPRDRRVEHDSKVIRKTEGLEFCLLLKQETCSQET